MFFNNDDDESDFLSPSGSKLASLFGGGSKSAEGGNESLTYTAPKEPKKKKPDSEEGNKMSNQTTRLMCAVAVHAYKLVEGSYEAQGKLGAAVLANTLHKEYKVLLYKGKQQPVTQAVITQSFVLTVQKNNYATLYDDMRQTWSLNFESPTNLETFAKQVCVAKATSGTLDTLISQDLSYGEGGQLEAGDSVEMKYTAHLFDGSGIGAVIDANNGTGNVSRFKVGRGKVIKGWDEGLVGMRKAGRRLLVVPPSMGGGGEMKGKVPANSTVVYEVDVIRVKLNKDRETASPRESENPSPTPEEETSNDSPTPEQPGTQSSKAKLLSRIAKMGQPMLPGMGGGGGQTEAGGDKTTEHEKLNRSSHQTRRPMDTQPTSPMKPDIPTKPAFHHPTSHSATQPVSQPVSQALHPPPQVTQPVAFQPVIQPSYAPVQQPVPGPMTSQLALYQSNPAQVPMQYAGQFGPMPPPQYGAMYGQPYQQAPPPPAPVAATPAAPSTEVALSESRHNNSELRLSLSKVADKVEKIYDKVEIINTRQNQQSASVMPNMEAGVLLHNITRIVQENERLKSELFDKDGKIEHQNEKINELIQRNQKYIEQSHLMLEQRSDTFNLTASQSQGKVLSLEQDKVKLTSELSACTSQLSSLQLEITALMKREMELKQQLDGLLTSDQGQKTELSGLRVTNAENETKVEQLSSQLKDEKRRRKEVETQLVNVQEEQGELKGEYHTLERTLTERKKKFSEERQKLEQEIEEMKSGLEAEITDLKERLKKQKSSTDVVTAEQISKMEEKLDQDWKEKNERLLASAQDRHKRVLAEVEEEKRGLEEKIGHLEQKLSVLKSSRGEADGQMVELQEELEDMKVWKDKYDNLRSQAGVMKERFETRIGELEKDVETVQEDRQRTVERAREAQGLVQSQLMEARDQVSDYQTRLHGQQTEIEKLTARIEEQKTEEVVEGGLTQTDVNTQVKKIMSSVYSSASTKFQGKQTYSGTSIQQTLLSTIKSVTLTLLSGGDVTSPPPQEEEEESEEEEETEDEEPSDQEDEVSPDGSQVVSTTEHVVVKSAQGATSKDPDAIPVTSITTEPTLASLEEVEDQPAGNDSSARTGGMGMGQPRIGQDVASSTGGVKNVEEQNVPEVQEVQKLGNHGRDKKRPSDLHLPVRDLIKERRQGKGERGGGIRNNQQIDRESNQQRDDERTDNKEHQSQLLQQDDPQGSERGHQEFEIEDKQAKRNSKETGDQKTGIKEHPIQTVDQKLPTEDMQLASQTGHQPFEIDDKTTEEVSQQVETECLKDEKKAEAKDQKIKTKEDKRQTETGHQPVETKTQKNETGKEESETACYQPKSGDQRSQIGDEQTDVNCLPPNLEHGECLGEMEGVANIQVVVEGGDDSTHEDRKEEKSRATSLENVDVEVEEDSNQTESIEKQVKMEEVLNADFAKVASVPDEDPDIAEKADANDTSENKKDLTEGVTARENQLSSINNEGREDGKEVSLPVSGGGPKKDVEQKDFNHSDQEVFEHRAHKEEVQQEGFDHSDHKEDIEEGFDHSNHNSGEEEVGSEIVKVSSAGNEPVVKDAVNKLDNITLARDGMDGIIQPGKATGQLRVTHQAEEVSPPNNAAINGADDTKIYKGHLTPGEISEIERMAQSLVSETIKENFNFLELSLGEARVDIADVAKTTDGQTGGSKGGSQLGCPGFGDIEGMVDVMGNVVKASFQEESHIPTCMFSSPANGEAGNHPDAETAANCGEDSRDEGRGMVLVEELEPDKALSSDEDLGVTSPDGADFVVCRTEVAPNTGKHGNPNYAAQLAETTGKNESEETKSEPPKKKLKSKLDTSPAKSKVDTSPAKSKVDTSPTKSKVNTSPTKSKMDTSLTKSKLDTSPPKSYSTKSRTEKAVDQRGSARDKTTASGDSGKPNQEEKAGVVMAIGPVVVKTKTQASTGSRGNPHYMASLNRATKTASRGHNGTTSTPKPNASDTTTTTTTTTNPSKVTHKAPTPRPASTRHTRPVSAASDTHQSNRTTTKTTATSLTSSRPYSARQKITTDKAAPGKKSGVVRSMDDVDQTITSKDGGQKQSKVSKTTTANARVSANSAARGRTSPTAKNSDPSVISAKTEKKPFTTSSRPTSISLAPNGTSSRPGSTSSKPGSISSRPKSTSSRPGSTSSRPGSTSTQLSSSSRAGNISSRTTVKSTKPVNRTVNEAGSLSDAVTSNTSSRPVSSSKTMSVSSRPSNTSTRPGSSGSSRPSSTNNTKKPIMPAQKEGVKDTIKTIVRSNATTNVKDRSLKPSPRPSGPVNGAASDNTRKVVPSKVGTLKSTPAVVHSKHNKQDTGEKSGLSSKADLAKASSSGSNGGQGTKSRSKLSDGTAEQSQGRNKTVRNNSAGSQKDTKDSKVSAVERVSGGSVVQQQKPIGKAKRNDDREAVDVKTVNSGAEIEPEKEASHVVESQPTAESGKVGVIQADIIAVERAQNSGHLGHPHYAKELEDMAGQKEGERQERTDDLKDAIESIIGSQIGEKDSGASIQSEKREEGQVKNKPGQVEMDQKKEEISAVKVVPVSSAKKQEAIKETKAGLTGDRGNPYYAEELKKADDSSNTKEKPEEASLVQKVEDAAKLGSSAPDQNLKGAGDQDKHVKEKEGTGNREGGIATPIEPVVKVTNTAITGDKGNIHYAKELEALAVLKTEGSGGEREVLQAVTPVSGATPGVGHNDVKQGGQRESAVKKTEAAVTGEKGNPHYAEELNRISESMAKVDEKEQGNKEARIGDVKSEEAASGMVKQDIKITEVSKTGCQPGGVGQAKVEPIIRAVDAAVTGDRGNIHYARELEASSADVKSGGKPELEKQEIIKVEKLPTCTKGVSAEASKLQSGPVIKSESAGICGDKGNIHYTRELESVSAEMQGSSSKPDVIKQEEIKVKNLQSTKAQAPKKDDSQKADIKETSKPQGEPMIKAESASVTGDKGNVHYAKELDVLSREESGNVKQSAEKQEEIVVESVTMMKTSAPVTGTIVKEGRTEPDKVSEPVINTEHAAICGDKGNTHYAKELEALSDEVSGGEKSQPQTEQAIKAVSVTGVKSAAPEAGTKDTGDKSGIKSEGEEARITAEKASVTGDRGNVQYAKKLEALTGKLEAESKSDTEKREELKIESVSYSKSSASPTAVGVPQSETVKARKEPVIEAASAAVTGDRGNVHYARELADLAGQVSKEEKEVLKAEQVAGLKSGATTGSDKVKPQVEPVIEATRNTAVCGDKGNLHYTKELEVLSKEVSGDKKQEAEIKVRSVTMVTTSAALKGGRKVDATEEVMKSDAAGKSMITSECAAVSGDKGNVHYTKELDALAEAMQKDSQPTKQETDGIKAESVSQTSQGVAKEKDEQNKSGNVTPQGEAVIKTIHTAVTGDKGNVNYAKELDALSRQTMGDQKNHSVPKPEETKLEAVSVVKTSASVAKNVEDMKAETIVAYKEPTIKASEAAVAGDRGNVHYAMELTALDKKPVVDKTNNSKKREDIKAEAVQVVTTSMTGTFPGQPIIEATHGAVTGDRGNVHYVKELDAVVSKEKMEDKNQEVKVETASVLKTSRPSSGAKEQAAKVDTETVGTQGETVLKAIHATVSGDKGNVHYSKDLDASTKEVDDGKKMQSKDEKADTIKFQMVSATSAPVTGQGKAIEPQVVGTEASVTGDKGNVHYSAELERLSQTTASKDTQPQRQEEGSEEPLKVVHAQVTGDKGNPHYAAELEENHAKQTEEDQAKETSGKGEGQVNTKGHKENGEGQSDENMNIAGKDSQNQGPAVSLEDVKPTLTAKKGSKKSKKK